MPESHVHATLVSLLLRFLDERHGHNLGLCVYRDTATADREDKPRRINGYVPDILALTVPASFTIIGEAKLHRDLDTPHSRSQLRAFLRFLRYTPDPFPYQIEALHAIEGLEFAAVFHEPGLGKTKIAIDLLLSWFKGGVVDSVIVVTKRSLIANWRAELESHSHHFPLVLSQNRRANYAALNSPGRVYLTHYEVFKTDQNRLRLFLKTRRVAVILDEAQKIKNPSSALFRAFAQLRTDFVRRIVLTGTPIANRPYDIWALIYFLDGGQALGRDFKPFREAFDISPLMAHDRVVRRQFEENLRQLFERIQAFSVRETKKSARIVLPDKVVENVLVEPEELQEELYRQYRDATRAAVEKQGTMSFDDIDEVVKRLLRLVQVASNPRLVTDAYDREPGKLPVLRNLLFDAKAEESKAIVCLDDYLQAQDRIHRISQEKTCYVYNLLLKDSVDLWVDELLTAKHLAAQLGQADIDAAEYRSRATYSFGEILKAILGPVRSEANDE